MSSPVHFNCLTVCGFKSAQRPVTASLSVSGFCAKTSVVAIEKNLPYSSVLETILDSGYSRIPVFEDSFDTIVGVIYIKDLLAHIEEKEDFEYEDPNMVVALKQLNNSENITFKELKEVGIHIII